MKRKASKAAKVAKAVAKVAPKAKPSHAEAKPSQAKAKPSQAKAKHSQAKAKPSPVKAKRSPVKAKPVAAKPMPLSAKAKPVPAKVPPVPAPPPVDPKTERDRLCGWFGGLFRQLRVGFGYSQEDITGVSFPRSTLGGMERAAAGTGLETQKKGAQAIHVSLGWIMLLGEAIARNETAMPFMEPIAPGTFRHMLIRILSHALRRLKDGAPLDALLSSFRAKEETGPAGLPSGGKPPET